MENALAYLRDNDKVRGTQWLNRVFLQHCNDGVSGAWADAQEQLVNLKADAGDLQGALQSARLCFDAAREGHRIGHWTNRIADLFRRLDKNKPERADAFVQFQRLGPAGRDNKLGTSDDLTNPLEAIGYPSDPEREAAFAKAFAAAGDGARASYHRAMLCLFTGKPRQAVPLFHQAIRCAEYRDMGLYAQHAVVNGLRAAQGHSLGLDKAAGYLLWGSSGQDGKPGTPDDLTDPFKPWLPGSTPNGWSAPAGDYASRSALTEIETTVAAAVAGNQWTTVAQAEGLRAKSRVHQSLGNWATQVPWYKDLLYTRTEQPAVQAELLAGAVAAVKSQEMSFAQAKILLQEAAAQQWKLLSPDAVVNEVLHRAGDEINRLQPLTRPENLIPR